jgi:hypothetical protein
METLILFFTKTTSQVWRAVYFELGVHATSEVEHTAHWAHYGMRVIKSSHEGRRP